MVPLPSSDRALRVAAALGLAWLLIERLALVVAAPDLVHDLDPGELKVMDLALWGLPPGEELSERLYRWLAGPENIHHGGYPVLSVLYLPLHALFGPSLASLRLLGIAAALAAAGLCTSWLWRQGGPKAGVLGLALWLGAPPLFLKWNCTVRGGHLEAIALVAVLLLCLQSALDRGGRGRWLAAGVVAGFSVYFSYLCLSAVLLLPLGALAQSRAEGKAWPELKEPLFALAGGAVLGFSPWFFGLLVLDLPYLAATIHASADPCEAATVRTRGLLETLGAATTALPHNLWPWTVTTAQHGAYLAPEPDILDYELGAGEWATRAAVAVAVAVGLLTALRRRAFLALAFFALPAAHYLFVMRAGNQPGYPHMPHRYLVLVFPALAAASGYGVGTWLDAPSGSRRKLGGRVLASLLALLALLGGMRHNRWLGPPAPRGAEAAFDLAAIREAGLGRVRWGEGGPLRAILAQAPEDETQSYWQGIARVYSPLADYYLLFRPDDEPPYPNELFGDEDPGPTTLKQRQAEVIGALRATRLRAKGDSPQVHQWVGSWNPSPHYRKAASTVVQQELPGVSCGWCEAPPPEDSGQAPNPEGAPVPSQELRPEPEGGPSPAASGAASGAASEAASEAASPGN